jgi:hypothetical protein
LDDSGDKNDDDKNGDKDADITQPSYSNADTAEKEIWSLTLQTNISSAYRIITQLLTRPSRSISLLGTIAPVRRYIIVDIYVLIVPQRLICWLIMHKQRAIVFACLMYNIRKMV